MRVVLVQRPRPVAHVAPRPPRPYFRGVAGDQGREQVAAKPAAASAAVPPEPHEVVVPPACPRPASATAASAFVVRRGVPGAQRARDDGATETNRPSRHRVRDVRHFLFQRGLLLLFPVPVGGRVRFGAEQPSRGRPSLQRRTAWPVANAVAVMDGQREASGEVGFEGMLVVGSRPRH